jgi:hypothetical protein
VGFVFLILLWMWEGEWVGDGVRSTARELRGQPRRSVSEKELGFRVMMSHKKFVCFVLFRSLSNLRTPWKHKPLFATLLQVRPWPLLAGPFVSAFSAACF